MVSMNFFQSTSSKKFWYKPFKCVISYSLFSVPGLRVGVSGILSKGLIYTYCVSAGSFSRYLSNSFTIHLELPGMAYTFTSLLLALVSLNLC